MALNGIAVAPRYRQTGRYIQAMGRLAPPDSLDGVERGFQGGLGSRPGVRQENDPRHLATMQRNAFQGPRRARIDLGA